MKTLTATQKFSKYLSLTVTALVAVIAMTGCGKKNNNNNLINGGLGVVPCSVNCVGGGALIASAFATSNLEDFYLHFTGVSAVNGGFQQNYQGQVGVQGMINVKYNSPATCNLVVGQYQVTTMQPGTLQGQSIVQSVIAQATGPTQVILEFTPYMYMNSSYAVQSPFDGQQFAYRLNGPIKVRSTQGQLLCVIDVG